MAGEKEPVAKLPLAVRKDFRDNFESKKEDLEKQISEVLGAEWKIDVNPNAIFAYAEPNSYGHNSLGSCVTAYINGFIYQLKRFVDKHGPEGVAELNSVAHAHTVALQMLDSPKWTYGGCDITSEGVFRLLFKPTMLGTNIDDTAANIAKEVSDAPQPESAPTLSYAARHSIKTEYDPKIEEVRKQAADELQNPDFKFEPDFEALVATLKTKKWDRWSENWQDNIGSTVLKYFEAFVYVLKREKFGEDDMLREGFAEAADKGVVRFRVIPKLPSGYNRSLIENGELILETDLDNWRVNIDQVASKLVDLL
ncbi:hypothetical protein F5884DRAFT_418998 [Xylogone sp. PMI_703]|nr:hypothetical protein F5884DRAFT_418998 [Xylogone sp. PMI_703]